MTGGPARPGPEDVRRAFAVVPDMEEIRVEDAVAASERAVLGSAIQSSALAAEALAVLTPEHFGGSARRVVFEAVMRLADAGQPVEPATVLSELARAGMLAKVREPDMGSGGAYLHTLVQRAGSVAYHAQAVLADWQRREVRSAAITCREIAESANWDPAVHLDEIRKRVEDATAFTGPGALRPNSEAVYEVLGALGGDADPGLSTGYRDLDDAIGGLRAPDLIVVGGRPGNGKSLTGLCIADHVASRLRLPVLFASLEMTEEQLTLRRISSIARVPLTDLVRNQVTDGDWDAIARARERLADTDLYVDEKSSASVGHIRGRLKAMERAGHPARLLVIDYLGFMAAPKAESRQQSVAELARQCKNALAREFGIPVILLCQLNRLVETRSEKRPGMADLRESGEIEQSADIVILLHREDAYERESPRAGEIDFIIAKNRQGPPCTITLAFQGHYGRIVSMAPGDLDPDAEWSPSRAAE